jgi:hypothetical protein
LGKAHGRSEADLERKKAVNNRRLLMLLGGIALIGVAFLFLSFRLAVSNNQSTKLVAITDLGNDNMPVAMQRNDKISIVLVGEGPLARALQKALTEKIVEAGIGEIELAQALAPAYQNPVLLVKVGKPGPLWTPFFATSNFSIHAGYASNGDTTFMEVIEKTHVSTAKKDVAHLYAEYEVKDVSLGLISRLGYHQYLADTFAQEIVTALKDLYNV